MARKLELVANSLTRTKRERVAGAHAFVRACESLRSDRETAEVHANQGQVGATRMREGPDTFCGNAEPRCGRPRVVDVGIRWEAQAGRPESLRFADRPGRWRSADGVRVLSLDGQEGSSRRRGE